MALITFGLTDIGVKRSSNQDSIFLSEKLKLFIVADGMGGHNGGDIASKMAVDLLPEFFSKSNASMVEEKLKNAMTEVNRVIFQKSQENPLLKGMGTTIVFTYFEKDRLHIGNIGDSRCYLIHHQQLFQLSRDHSLIQEKLNMGVYTREEGKKDRMKNVLTRSVGFEKNLQVDLYNYKMNRGDLILLCSDGLHGKLGDENIIKVINELIPNPMVGNVEVLQKTTNNLIEMAKEFGGEDNISVILALAL